MPEYPNITVYVERSRERVQGLVLRKLQLLNPSGFVASEVDVLQACARAATAALAPAA